MTTTIPRHLEDRLRDGRVIPFVGAGVSMAARRRDGEPLFPSWKELLLAGAARLEHEGTNADVVRALLEDDQPDYLHAARKLREKLGPLWGAFLKDAIDVSRAEVDDRSLELARAVWRLGSRLVVTTNYDRVLQWACPDELRDDCKTWYVDAPAEQAEYLRRGEVRAPTVWHLHGHVDNAAGVVLTPDGYATLYPAADLPILRATLFVRRATLFVSPNFSASYGKSATHAATPRRHEHPPQTLATRYHVVARHELARFGRSAGR